jgi:hypothetical protein
MALNTADLTKTPPEGRPLYKRLTLIGGASFEAFSQTNDSLFAAGNSLGGLLTLFGAYRQISSD